MPLFSPKWGKTNKGAKAKAPTKQAVQNEQNGSLPSDPQHLYEGDTQPHTVLPNTLCLSDVEKHSLRGSGPDQSEASVVRTCSRLTKTLYEILHDKDALPYFIQYMDSRQVGHLVRFWLDAQSFQVSALTRVRSRSFNQDKSSKPFTSPSGTFTGNTSAEVHHPVTVGASGLQTADSSSAGDNRGFTKTNAIENFGIESICDKPQCKDIQSPSNSVHSENVMKSRGCDGNISTQPAKSNLSSHSDPSAAGDLHTASSRSVPCLSTSSNHPVTTGATTGTTTGSNSNNNSAHGGSVCMNSSPVRGSGSCDASNADVRNQCNNASHSNISKNHCIESDAAKLRSMSESNNSTQSEPNNKGTFTNVLESGGDDHVTLSGASEASDPSVHGDSELSPRVSVVQESKSVSQEGATQGNIEGDKRQKASIQDKLLQSIAQDAVRMFSKYIALEATHPIGVTDELRAKTISRICSEDGHVDPSSFVQCQDIVVSKMDQLYYPEFLVSWFHCKHQFDILSSSDVYLADFLYNDNAFSYLTEYMELEGAMCLLQCWLDLDSFQQLLVSRRGQYDGLEAQNDAMVIYDKYFSMQASHPLGFSDAIRLDVEGNICREEGPLPDCFCKAKSLVLTALETHYFSGFVESDVYYKYMADLMSTVQAAEVPTHARKHRKESDTVSTTSDHSLGSQSAHSEIGATTKNTLLAAGKSRQGGIKKALHKMDDNMQIDGALFNPDTLWKRPQAGKMSLGKVDELGRFVSELELEPDKPKLGFLKKKKEKEQTQEEMAAQIALKIVAGITANAQVGNEASFEKFDKPP